MRPLDENVPAREDLRDHGFLLGPERVVAELLLQHPPGILDARNRGCRGLESCPGTNFVIRGLPPRRLEVELP